jgi:PHD/YefM family antitoxin component YafN of YafNO toxin-antitoxin module
MAYCISTKSQNYERSTMPTLTATEARSKLYRLIDEAASSHEPIVITGKRGSAVKVGIVDLS